MKVEKQLTEAHGDPVNGVHRRFKTNLYIPSQRWQQTHAGEKNREWTRLAAFATTSQFPQAGWQLGLAGLELIEILHLI